MKNFKNSILKTFVLAFLLSCSSTLLAQEPDLKRLQRDIDIAQSILVKLFGEENEQPPLYHFQNNSRNFFLSAPREGGSGYYVNGQGVVLQIPQNHLRRNFRETPVTPMIWNGQTIPSENKKIQKEESLDKEKVKGLISEFYLKYADLIGQLKPGDKIIVVYEEPEFDDYEYEEEEEEEEEEDSDKKDNKKNMQGQKRESTRLKISAEIDRQSVSDMKSAKLSEQDFLKKITFHESQIKKNNNFEFDVFSGILETLFREGNHQYVVMNDNVEYNLIEGYGVNYYITLQTIHNSDFHDALSNRYDVFYSDRRNNSAVILAPNPTIRRRREPQESNEENIKINKSKLDSLQAAEKLKMKQALEEIEPQLKEYIIEYGRTLKGLKPDEVLVLNVRINQWVFYFDRDEEEEKENMMRLSVKKSVLSAYDNREITLEDAKSKVEITR